MEVSEIRDKGWCKWCFEPIYLPKIPKFLWRTYPDETHCTESGDLNGLHDGLHAPQNDPLIGAILGTGKE